MTSRSRGVASSTSKSGDRRPLTLEEAAARLGVHYMTAYRYVRLGQMDAHLEEGRWWVEQGAVDAVIRRPSPRRRRPGDVRWAALRERLVRRLDDGDVAGAWSIFEGVVAAGRSPVDIYVKLLAPVMRQVGEEWARGRRSIESEHRASAVALRCAARLGTMGRAGRRRQKSVVLGGAPGDAHQLPGLMLADALRWEGFRVVDLGADTPTESFVEAALTAPHLIAVGVSVSTDPRRSDLVSVFDALREAAPDALLLAGGPALADAARARAHGADGWAPDATAAVQLLVEST